MGTVVSTEGQGVAKGASLELTVPDEYELDEGHSLVLSADVTGNGTFNPCFLSLDIQVRGS